MPQMTGIDLLRKVRGSEQFAHIPFLMVTAEAQQENIIEAVQAKVSNYIVKPFTADTMPEWPGGASCARARPPTP